MQDFSLIDKMIADLQSHLGTTMGAIAPPSNKNQQSSSVLIKPEKNSEYSLDDWFLADIMELDLKNIDSSGSMQKIPNELSSAPKIQTADAIHKTQSEAMNYTIKQKENIKQIEFTLPNKKSTDIILIDDTDAEIDGATAEDNKIQRNYFESTESTKLSSTIGLNIQIETRNTRDQVSENYNKDNAKQDNHQEVNTPDHQMQIIGQLQQKLAKLEQEITAITIDKMATQIRNTNSNTQNPDSIAKQILPTTNGTANAEQIATQMHIKHDSSPNDQLLGETLFITKSTVDANNNPQYREQRIAKIASSMSTKNPNNINAQEFGAKQIKSVISTEIEQKSHESKNPQQAKINKPQSKTTNTIRDCWIMQTNPKESLTRQESTNSEHELKSSSPHTTFDKQPMIKLYPSANNATENKTSTNPEHELKSSSDYTAQTQQPIMNFHPSNCSAKEMTNLVQQNSIQMQAYSKQSATQQYRLMTNVATDVEYIKRDAATMNEQEVQNTPHNHTLQEKYSDFQEEFYQHKYTANDVQQKPKTRHEAKEQPQNDLSIAAIDISAIKRAILGAVQHKQQTFTLSTKYTYTISNSAINYNLTKRKITAKKIHHSPQTIIKAAMAGIYRKIIFMDGLQRKFAILCSGNVEFWKLMPYGMCSRNNPLIKIIRKIHVSPFCNELICNATIGEAEMQVVTSSTKEIDGKDISNFAVCEECKNIAFDDKNFSTNNISSLSDFFASLHENKNKQN